MFYTAEMDEPDCTAKVKCDDCGWQGIFADVSEIESCSLTPGDPSPAGRCPECDILAYLVPEQGQ